MLDFQQKQLEFASHLRDPALQLAPADIEERRLQIYRDLFYNNIENFISSGFPVLRSLFSDKDWHVLVRDFYTVHKAQTPYFLKISEEFLNYLEKDTLPCHQLFPFIKELAHYEWVELALDVLDEDIEKNVIIENDTLLTQCLYVSNLAWPLVYQWPVHQIGKNAIPAAPTSIPTCLVVYRNPHDKVEFMAVNPATLRLLTLINTETKLTGQQALITLAGEMQQLDTIPVLQFGQQLLTQLYEAGIVGVYDTACH